MVVGFAPPAGVPVPVPAAPLPFAGMLLVTLPVGLAPLFVPPFAGAPLLEPFPFVVPLLAGVDDGLGFVGSEVTGVGTSGIGVDRTLATSSVTFASVAVLLRYL